MKLTQDQISDILYIQRRVWAGNEEAEKAILDTCYAFAKALNLDNDEKEGFMERTGYYWKLDVCHD